MERQEAISYIEKNWPPENYAGLREALTMAVAALRSEMVPCHNFGTTERTKEQWRCCIGEYCTAKVPCLIMARSQEG